MTRNFLEHYYTTSIRKDGLFTIDASPGLSPDEIVELEKKGLYKKAALLPETPTPEQIAYLFPVNNAHYKLKSGRYAYLRSTYTGRANHTPDRFNNFFSHSLILADGIPDFPAACVLLSHDFKNFLSREEDETYQPHLHQIKIDLGPQQEQEHIIFRYFCHFIGLQPRGLGILASLLETIIDGDLHQPGKNCTLCDEKNNLDNWMLAINFLLPPATARDLSFASFTADPANSPFKLTGITRDCEIGRLDHRYFTLIDATSANPKQKPGPFTEKLLNIVENVAFGDWKTLMNETAQFNLATLGNGLRVNQYFISNKNTPAPVLETRNQNQNQNNEHDKPLDIIDLLPQLLRSGLPTMNTLQPHTHQIERLSEKDRKKLLIQSICQTFTKPFDTERFAFYNEVVNKFLPGQSPEFWNDLFAWKKYREEDDPTKHSLNYLKKCFITRVWLDEKIKNKNALLEAIHLSTEEEKWIEEAIRENTTVKIPAEFLSRGKRSLFQKIRGF